MVHRMPATALVVFFEQREADDPHRLEGPRIAQAKQIAQVTLAAMSSSQNFPMDGPIFAGITVMTIPLVVLAIALQKFYVRGLMTSGIK